MNFFLRTTTLVLLTLTACGRSEQSIQEDFDSFLSDSDQCEVAADCVVIYPGCPLGCAATVNEEHEQEAIDLAESLIKQYESGGQACDYSCIEAEAPTCNDSHCTLPN